MNTPKDFIDSHEMDVQDLGPVDGLWMFVSNSLLREAVNQGRPGMLWLDKELHRKMKYSGDGAVVISVPMMEYVNANGWPRAGFAVAVTAGDNLGVYVQPQDTVPDPSTRIAEA